MIRTRLAAALAVAAMAVSGCGFSGIYDLPLPGGADLGDRPYKIKVQFRDVLDLVPQSGVKVNEVAVGRVDEIGFAQDGWTAEVTLLVNGDVELPANALAKLRQSSLLGEKYIELGSPSGSQAQGRLADGALITVDRTNRNTEVEEVLGALSMLLNGGGVEQLNAITKELNKATEGNETEIKALLTNVETMVSTLDAGKGDITRALDGLNRLASTLNEQRTQITGVLDGIGPGLTVLTEQREQLVTMLQSLQTLSGVAVDTVNKSKEDLIADLKALTPTLQKLGEAGNNLPKALELMVTFPFTDQAVKGVKGDYFNLYLDLDLNLQSVLDNLSRTRQNPLQDIPILGGLTNGQDGVPANAQDGVPANAPPPLPLPGMGAQSPTPAQPGAGGTPQQQPPFGGIFDVLRGGGF